MERGNFRGPPPATTFRATAMCVGAFIEEALADAEFAIVPGEQILEFLLQTQDTKCDRAERFAMMRTRSPCERR